jgi:hypothetical protein
LIQSNAFPNGNARKGCDAIMMPAGSAARPRSHQRPKARKQAMKHNKGSEFSRMALGVAMAAAAVGGACVTDPNSAGIFSTQPSPQASEKLSREREAARYAAPAQPLLMDPQDRGGGGAGGGGGGGGGGH